MKSNTFDKNIVKVLSFLLISPGSRYKRKELKDKTKMNNVPLDNTLKKLKSLKIIEEKKNIISLNLIEEENKEIFNIISREYKSFNLPYNIFNILVEISEKLSKINEINEAILFGSYSKLIYTDKSDIDIVIIFKDKIKKMNIKEKQINNEIRKISKKSNKDIQLHFFSVKDIKENKSDPLIKDILRNGKKIL
ncbi:MAG: nucleotidyltransferase domain-containing protein [Nanoarchaeota archaeon]|mgnify:CR=1 FL=1